MYIHTTKVRTYVGSEIYYADKSSVFGKIFFILRPFRKRSFYFRNNYILHARFTFLNLHTFVYENMFSHVILERLFVIFFVSTSALFVCRWKNLSLFLRQPDESVLLPQYSSVHTYVWNVIRDWARLIREVNLGFCSCFFLRIRFIVRNKNTFFSTLWIFTKKMQKTWYDESFYQ